MKIAVIGGGFSGLGAAYELAHAAHNVVIYEKSSELGGLASSVLVNNEPVENFYHHIFPTYYEFRNIAGALGIKDNMFFRHAKTGIFYHHTLYPFNSPFDLMRFSPLTLYQRLKTGLISAKLKYSNNWEQFEGVTAVDWLKRKFGARIYEVIWEPLLRSKFGRYTDQIGMTWFWSRIYERPSKFGYFHGGFKTLTDALEKDLKKCGTVIHKNTEVQKIEKGGNGLVVTTKDGHERYDRVVIAAPPVPFLKLSEGLLDKEFSKRIKKLKYFGTVCVLLTLKKKFMPYYWLNINEKEYPFLALVEHTNFIPQKKYGNRHIVYVAKYLDPEEEFYRFDDEKIWSIYFPFLKKINPAFAEDWIITKSTFRAPFTQPIITQDYGKIKPDYRTPVPELWWVSMSHIYPWDRGTGHSFHTGRELARILMQMSKSGN